MLSESEVLSKGPRADGFVVDAAAAIRARSVRGQQLLVWVIFLCLVAAILWAYFAVLDEVVRGSGKVIPSSQVQVVQNLEGGIIEQISVTEGELVVPGQVLLTIDDTRFDSSLQESRIRSLSLQAKLIRLQAEADGLEAMPEMPQEIAEVLPRIFEQEKQLFAERRGYYHHNVMLPGFYSADRRGTILGTIDDIDVVALEIVYEVRSVRLSDDGQRHGAHDIVERTLD